MGRYAYANQPRIALWNLTRLAECLLPLFADDQDKAIAAGARPRSAASPTASTRPIRPACARKLGLFTEREGDQALAQDLLDAMAAGKADFTLTFRRLSDAAGDGDRRRGPGAVRRSRRRSTNGRARWRQRTRRGAAIRRPSGGRRCAPSIRPSSRATTASRR